MFKFSRAKLAQSHEGPWLLLDMAMLGILMINLLWIIFDMVFATELIQSGLNYLSPALVSGYLPIHNNFALIDLAFVALFLTEFCLRWAAAVWRKEYMRWYFFPFLHWYDLVGCIPLSGARIFRFLRIFSILYRLQKHQIIDLKTTALWRFVAFYYDVFVEELSDRIVLKVLTDAQKDLTAGSPLLEDINKQVLATRKPLLCDWLAAMMKRVGASIADEQHGSTVREHVRQSVGNAVRNNNQVASLRLVPVLGSGIEKLLENAVTDIVTQSLINLLQDVSAQKIQQFIDHGLNEFSEQEQQLDQQLLLVVDECIELLKSHVGQQRWKDHFDIPAKL
jgi:hypothetical protein